MATTGQNFVRLTVATLVVAAVKAIGTVLRLNPSNAAQVVTAGNATVIDKVIVDFSTDANAKHGAATLALTGTTPKTVTLVDLTSATDSNDGDTVFATFNKLVISNLGAGSLTIAQGATNPASLGLAGTTPTLTIPAGAVYVLDYPAGVTVDSTHKTIDVTPAATTVFSIAVSGS